MRLLLTGAFNYTEEQLNKLKILSNEIVFVQDERVPLQLDVQNIDAIVCNGLFLYNDITKFKNLKFIQLTSAGFERVPIGYIEEHEIQLFNAKGIYSIPIAEWVLLKILEIYKNSRHFYFAQYKKKWDKKRDLLELTNKTAAIIGFGNIGTEIAKRLKAFGVYLIGVGKRKIQSELLDEYFTIDDIDEVLSKSDIVILTLPLTKKTRNIINAEKISKMKQNSVLVNVSRGGVIDQTALTEELNGEKFLGLALDVFEEEPLPMDSPLWDFKRVIITPHNSFVSEKTNERLFNLLIKNLNNFLFNREK